MLGIICEKQVKSSKLLIIPVPLWRQPHDSATGWLTDSRLTVLLWCISRTPSTCTIRRTPAMLLTVPFGTRRARFALSAVLPMIHGHPVAPAEAVPEAVEVVRITVAQCSTQQFELEPLPVFSGLLRLGILGLQPFLFPVLERPRVFFGIRPRRVIIEEHVDHQVDVQLLNIWLVR